MLSEKMPLAGLKILDLTRVYSGPYCTMMMGDLGAESSKLKDRASETIPETLCRSRMVKAGIMHM